MTFIEKQVTELAKFQTDNIDLAIELLMQHIDYDDSSYLKFIKVQLKLLKLLKEHRQFCNHTVTHLLSAYNVI